MSPMPAQKPGRSKQDYRTPKEFLDAVRRRLHIEDFVMDLAASDDNHVCSGYYTEEEDALQQSWVFDGWCWLNPPYSNIRPWVEKAAGESWNGAQIAMLVPAAVGANWWRHWVANFSYQSFLNGRITFDGCTAPYPKDCALLLYTPWGFIGNEIWGWANEQ